MINIFCIFGFGCVYSGAFTLLCLPVEWQPSTPSTTLHSCAGLHCQGSQVTLWLPWHLQRSEQSSSVNQLSPTWDAQYETQVHIRPVYIHESRWTFECFSHVHLNKKWARGRKHCKCSRIFRVLSVTCVLNGKIRLVHTIKVGQDSTITYGVHFTDTHAHKCRTCE